MNGGGKFMFPCLGPASFLSDPPTSATPSDQPGLTLQGAGGQAHVQWVPLGRPWVLERQ